MCSLHHVQGDEEHEFLSLASKPRSTVSPGLASKPMATVLVVLPQNLSLGFPGPKKSSQQFLGLSLKTMWVMVCQLHNKTDGRMKMAWDMR
jgi:hypothetical protein